MSYYYTNQYAHEGKKDLFSTNPELVDCPAAPVDSEAPAPVDSEAPAPVDPEPPAPVDPEPPAPVDLPNEVVASGAVTGGPNGDINGGGY